MNPVKPGMIVILCLCLFACNYPGRKSENLKMLTVNTTTKSMEEAVSLSSVSTDSLFVHNNKSNTEEYDQIAENTFLTVTQNPLSTFSTDVDDAAYSTIRRMINDGRTPPPGIVRIEEMINYFDYDYPAPKEDDPFFIHTELSDCPWNNKHQLIHIGLKGKEIPEGNLPPANFVFLVDVSGSMDSPDKLPLLQQSLKLLVDKLRKEDRVAIAVYAGSSGLVLPSTSGAEKATIRAAIESLSAGGSTAGAEGILLAYKVATDNFLKAGNNRVILATDGDFNVGISSDEELVRLIEKEREKGIFLSVLGFGMGNYKDSKMQQLADKGNGNHSYIDNISEARKVLVTEFGSTLFTIANDVKLQLEFNPSKVQAYRLLGYENRLLENEDFNDDKKDAGEVGAGHTVTALYEIIPVGVKDSFTRKTDPLKYQQKIQTVKDDFGNELLTIKLRYKKPGGAKSMLLTKTVADEKVPLEKSSQSYRFSAAVAEFGLLLRNSAYRQQVSAVQVVDLAMSALGKDEFGYRTEFVSLVKKSLLNDVSMK